MILPDVRCAVCRLASRDIRLLLLWIGLFALPASALTAEVAGQPNASTSHVVFTCNFESPEWYREWGLDQPEPGTDTVAVDPALKFEPLEGRALRVRIPKGGQVGMGKLKFRFKQRTARSPRRSTSATICGLPTIGIPNKTASCRASPAPIRRPAGVENEMVWMDVYQGGKKPATSEDHLFIDNVVIARNYIGPLKKWGSRRFPHRQNEA
jgi:hypothetical protein